MKTLRISIIVLALGIIASCSQERKTEDPENRVLEFDTLDLKIVERADSILSNQSSWNKQDDRECNDDIATGRYSLFCSLYKASIDVLGEYVHRRAGMQIVRFTLEKYENGRVKEHRLMDWNNHPDTSFEEVKKVLRESIEVIKQQLHSVDNER